MQHLKDYIISEGMLDWFLGLFKRSNNFVTNYKKRFNGKIDPIKVTNIKQISVSKPVNGLLDNDTLKNVKESEFTLLPEMYNKRNDYLLDKDDKELTNIENSIYVYKPEVQLSKDEIYMAAIGVNANTQYLEGYNHLIDFEVSEMFDNPQNLCKQIFPLYIDTLIQKQKSLKGLTVKYVNNANEFTNCLYKGKKFEIADDTIKLLKMTF